jgi:plastocyanin
VSPGDKITFVFSGSTGFTVTDIGGLNGLAGGLAWGQKSTADGTTSITATVTAAPVTVGTTHSEYSVVMQKAIAGSPPTFETATIDPDFETDVT